MQHAMPFGVFLVLISGGASANVGASADKVAIGANGALNSLPQHPAKAEAASRRNERRPNDSPFVLDTMPENPVHQSVKPVMPGVAPVPFSENAPFDVDDSFNPFEIVDGSAGGMIAMHQSNGASDIQAGMNDSPFVLDNQAHPPSAATPFVSAAPFVADSAVGASPNAAALGLPAVPRSGDSTFVVDSEVGSSGLHNVDLRNMDKQAVEVSTKVSKKSSTNNAAKGKLSIVKNGEPILGPQPPQPATTQMVMAFPDMTTTDTPTTSSVLKFELGGAMLEVRPGQMFVPITDTPFEMESHLALKLGQTPKAIELMRPEIKPAGLVATSATSDEGALNKQPTLVVATPHHAKRLMRNEERQGAFAEIRSGLAKNHQQDSQPNILPFPEVRSEELVETGSRPTISNVIGAETGVALADVMPAPSKPALPGQSKPPATPATAVSKTGEVPSSTQSALNSPVQLPAPQMTPGESVPNGVLAPPVGNKSLSTPQAVFNSSIAAAGTLNSTNSTAQVAQAITAKGAFISIFLGLLVTLFFLSLVLCILHAGRNESPEREQKEPLVPKRSYRQLFRDQDAEAKASQTASASTPAST